MTAPEESGQELLRELEASAARAVEEYGRGYKTGYKDAMQRLTAYQKYLSRSLAHSETKYAALTGYIDALTEGWRDEA